MRVHNVLYRSTMQHLKIVTQCKRVFRVNSNCRRGGFNIRPRSYIRLFNDDNCVEMIWHKYIFRVIDVLVLFDCLIEYSVNHAGGYGIRPYNFVHNDKLHIFIKLKRLCKVKMKNWHNRS